MLGFAFNTLEQANDIVINIENDQQVDQTSPYVVYGLVQVGISLLLMLKGVSIFNVFLNYYKKYQDTKRDNDIKESIKEAKYDQLYKDLNGTNLPDKRERLIDEFYMEVNNRRSKPSIGDMLEQLANAKRSVI
jgi:hypothetical protein